MYECISVNLLDFALIHNHLEFSDVLIHRFHPSGLNHMICNRYLFPQINNHSLHILILCLQLSHQQLVIINLLQEAVSLALYDISVLVILVLERQLDMMHSLNEPVLLLSEFPQLLKSQGVISLKLHVLFPEDDTSLPNDDLLDLKFGLLQILLKFKDPPLQLHILPKAIMSLVLRIFKLVSQLLIESFLSLDLSLKLGELSTEIINSIERW